MIPNLNIASLPSLPFSERGSLPTCRAVYVVCDVDGKVLYVGATSSLRDRLKNHHRQQQFEAAGLVSVSWIDVADRGTRRNMEARLIDQLEPSLNCNSVPLTEQRVTVSALVSVATKRSIRRLARKEGRTVSQTLGRLIERSLKALRDR